VLVGLGVAAWLIVPPPAPNAVANETLLVLENDLKPEQLTRVEVRTGDRTVVLLRDPGGKWSLPGGWPIREKEVGDLVELIAGLRPRFPPEPIGVQQADLANPSIIIPAVGQAGGLGSLWQVGWSAETVIKALAKYGLHKPAVTVTARTNAGSTYHLSFGEASAKPGERLTNPTWVRLDDRPEAVRLIPGIIAMLDRPADYYQQRRLFAAERV